MALLCQMRATRPRTQATVNENQAAQIRHGITAALSDLAGDWERHAMRTRLTWRAYDRTMSAHATDDQRIALAQQRAWYYQHRN